MKKLLFSLILFSLFIQPVNAELYDNQIDRYSGWTGFNDRGLDIGLKSNELSYVRNINYDNFPFINKREGYDKLNEYQISSDRIRGLFSFYRKNGTRFLLNATNQAIYKNTSGCMTQITTGLTVLDVEYDGVSYEDKFFVVNGSDPMMEYDGTSIADTGGSPPLFPYVEAHAWRIFGAGNCTYPNRVYYCDILDETDWSTTSEFGNNAGYFAVPLDDGDKITGMAVFADMLIIFGERSMYALLDAWERPSSHWVLEKISADIGCISNKTIIPAKKELFFVSLKGIHSFSGATTSIVYTFGEEKAFSLSDMIKGTFDDLNQAQWHKACGVDFDDKLWFAVPNTGSGHNDLVLIFDYVRGAWTVYDGIYANCFAVYDDGSGEDLYFGDSRNYGFIYKWGDVDYDGDIQLPATVTGTQSPSTLQDTTQSWDTDQFKGCRVHLYCGAGEGQTRTITANTANTLTVTPDWSVTPVSATTLYCVGGIEMIADTAFLAMNSEGTPLYEFYKDWLDVYVQAKAFGANTYYLKLLFDIDQTGWSPAFAIDLNNDYDDYGTNLWGEASYAGKDLITKKISLSKYKAKGKMIKVRLYNYRPNEEVCFYNILFNYKILPLDYTGQRDN